MWWQKIKNVYHLGVAILANIRYGFPARKLTVIGVTGTDGKTTTASLIYHIFKTAGFNVSLISTVGAIIHGKTYGIGFHVTNPSSFPLQNFLSKIANGSKKDNILVLEVTSHGLDQNRVWGVPFKIGLLTNITHEHLDYHKTYDNYVRAKIKLLQKAKVAIVNEDDGSFIKVKKYLKNKKLLTYGRKKEADIHALPFELPKQLEGVHNYYNSLAAFVVVKQFGINDSLIKIAFNTFKLPKGRLETVYKKEFTIVVDFAHTPNAFEQLLSSLRPNVKGRLIHVFGSAGARDITKRPLMGEIASKYDDIIVLTSEDPRKENPYKIIDDIEKGISKRKSLKILRNSNRLEAINTAIKIAKSGDLVVLTGKGHESSMNYGKGEAEWSEFEAVKKALKNRT